MAVMSFTFRQLEIFVEAARDGNFRVTADRLGISQPAVSKQIRALENALGQALFVRSRGSSARLSDAGHDLLSNAHDMLSRQRDLHGGALDRSQFQLRLIAGDYVMDNLIRPALREIHKQMPDLHLELISTNDRPMIIDKINAREVDIAIFSGAVPDNPSWNTEVIGTINCSLFAVPQIADAVGGDLERIAAAPFVLPFRGRYESWVRRTLREAGIEPRLVAGQSQFGDVVLDMVGEGVGIGMLFDEHVHRRLGDRVTRLPVDLPPAYRVMVLGERACAPRAEPMTRFIRTVCNTG